LFYRLNVVPIEVPPLRERLEELECLCEHFLRRAAERHGGAVKRLDRRAYALLRSYSWPGNVRELENLMERASILTAGEVISAEAIRGWLGEPEAPASIADTKLPETCSLAEMERLLIERTLARFHGHRQKTAEALGIGVRTLGLKLSKWRAQERQMVGA